jgi:hypothetical protein
MDLSAEFWQMHRGAFLIDESGTLRFTARGRARYAQRLARCGYDLAKIATISQFCDVMRIISDTEISQSDQQLRSFLADPSLSSQARLSIGRVLAF